MNCYVAAKLIVSCLPQFHLIPEDYVWWGQDFTEWRNITRARPLFQGQYQLHLPSDLGFCDLRFPETRQVQADLMRAYGIEVLISGQPDSPFCLCWASENWMRRWDGLERERLVFENAWNECTEDNYPESDQKWRFGYLGETFQAFGESQPEGLRIS